jgi:hypothetical protein
MSLDHASIKCSPGHPHNKAVKLFFWVDFRFWTKGNRGKFENRFHAFGFYNGWNNYPNDMQITQNS